MTADQIKSEIQKAAQGGGRLFIKGYTDSSGNVSDKTVRLLGDGEGYTSLVEESLKQAFSVANSDFSPEIFEEARSETISSFHKTLSGTQAPRKQNVTYEPEGDSRYVLKNGNAEEIVVMGLVQEKSELVKKAETKPVNSAEKTRAKEYIRLQLPVGKYVGQLILSPDKVESVKAL